jgi:DNA-binding transcriptional LysR family regulator
MAAALKKFQAAAPRVRVDLSEITVGEMKKRAKAGRLDLLILPERETQDLPGFQWILLRKIAFVAVMPATHPLARLKKISPARLRDVSLIGFDKEAFPSYSTHVRDSLRPFGVTPRFVALINDGTASVMAALEANHAVAVVSDSAEDIMPRNMVARPFSPSLANSNIVMGFSETQPNRHAATFARFLREEAEQSRPAKKAGNTKAF